MPYELKQRDGKWCVVLEGTDQAVPGGCHPTQPEAQRHLAALNSNVKDAAAVVITRTVASDCGCGSLARTGCTCHTNPVQTAAVATEPFDAPFPVPEYPPAEWLTEDPSTWVEEWRAAHGLGPSREVVETPQGAGVLYRLTVDDEGRAGGRFYEQGVCIVDGTATLQPGDHDCWEPPPSPTGYARFHQGDEVVQGGAVMQAGAIGNVGGHASPFVSASTAVRHYADPDAQLLVCRAYDAVDPETQLRYGYLAGALVPATTFGDVALLRRSALSGDWRWFAPDRLNPAGGYDCLGPTLVTRPGLALVQAFARTAGARPVYLGGCGGVQLTPGSGFAQQIAQHIEGARPGIEAAAREVVRAATVRPTPPEEANMRVTLADGTHLDVPDGFELAHENGQMLVRQSAAPPPPPPPPPGGGNGDEEPDDGGNGELEQRVSALEEQLSELKAMIEEAMGAQATAAAARLERLDAVPVGLDGN